METTNDATRATAEAMPDPTILSLYRIWDAEYERINRKGAGFTAEQMAVLCDAHSTVTDDICSLDSRSPLDVLAKIIAASGRMEECIAYEWADSIRDEALAMLAAESEPDPLFVAVNDYRKAMVDYNNNAPHDSDEADAYAEATYAPAIRVIKDWDRPAVSRLGAIEALRFAVQEARAFDCSDMLEPVLTAALAYFEQEARS